MLKSIVYLSENSSFAKTHRKKWGDYNDFPPNWEEISEAEFATSQFFINSVKLIEFRQMYGREPNAHMKPCVSANLHWFNDNTGFAIVNDHANGKIKYYKFGCKHKYRELDSEEKINHPFATSVCDNCAHYYAPPDSSD